MDDAILTPAEFESLREIATRLAITIAIAHEKYLEKVGLIHRTGLGLMPTPAGYARLQAGR